MPVARQRQTSRYPRSPGWRADARINGYVVTTLPRSTGARAGTVAASSKDYKLIAAHRGAGAVGQPAPIVVMLWLVDRGGRLVR